MLEEGVDKVLLPTLKCVDRCPFGALPFESAAVWDVLFAYNGLGFFCY